MKRKKSRQELHLEFIRKAEETLTKNSCVNTHHLPVDKEIERVRNKSLVKDDLFRYRSRVYKVIHANGMLLDAVDINTHEPLMILAYDVIKL